MYVILWRPTRTLVPFYGISQHTDTSDNNSLSTATFVCLGHLWWPLWWPETNTVPWITNEAQGAFGYLWFQQKWTKGTVGVFVVDHWLTIASVRMLRMSFL